MSKFRVSIKVWGRVVPNDFNFITAEIVVWATDASAAEEYARPFLAVHGISIFADIDEVTELA